MTEWTDVAATWAPQPVRLGSLIALLVAGAAALFLATAPAPGAVQPSPAAAGGQTTGSPDPADGQTPPSPESADETTSTPELTSSQQETYQQLVTELMSPFCQGLVLKDCPSSGAARMREQVREWVAEGRGEEWITERLVEQYGEVVRGSPEFEGFGIVGWLAPFLALAGGLVVLVAFLRGRGRGGSAPEHATSTRTRRRPEPGSSGEDREAAGTDADTEAIRRRVEAELEELEE